MIKNWITILCILVATANLSAQKTASYRDDATGYKTGLELFQQKKYGAALKQFNQYIDATETSGEDSKNHEYYIDALYYRAQCSNELDQPQAEKYFLDLVAYNEATPVTRMANYYLGNIYYKQKKYDKSISYFTMVSISDLSNEQMNEYRFQLGYCFFMKKKFDKAEAMFNVIKTVQNKYYYPSNYYNGYIAYTNTNYNEAMKSFDIIKDSKLYGPIIPYYTASIAYINGKYNEAITLANTALENDKLKYRDELKQIIGKSYFKLKQYEKALPYLKEYYDKISKANKSDIYEIGYCQHELKQYDDAIKSFTQLNTLRDSLGQSALYLLADSYLQTNQKNNARNAFLESSKINADMKLKEDAAYQYAKLTYELGFNDQASLAMQDWIKNYPKSKKQDEAVEILTGIFLNTNNYRDAVTVIQSITDKTPAIKQAYQKVTYARGVQLYNEKNYTDALKMFELSLNNPIDFKTQSLCYYWKGESFYALNKYTEANLNYFKFIEVTKIIKDFPLSTSMASANYGAGYCYLKKNDYADALTYFEKAGDILDKATNLSKDDQTYFDRIYPDCKLRTGDCYFVMKNYNKATTAYSTVIDKKMNGADYALFQRGMLNGLAGNNTAKTKDLQSVYNNYGTSIYLDDALFETGDTYLKNEEYESAILIFNQIINDYPSSRYVKNSHLKLGLIYFNTKRMTNSLDEYKIVVSKYPKTDEAKTAQDGAKEIFLSNGDADGYFKWVKDIPNSNITVTEADSLVYNAAERQFASQNYEAALQKFSDYINSYPKGAFASDAHYYRASCLMHNKDYTNALPDFEFVIQKNDRRFLENALLYAARINFYNNKNYEDAYKYYTQLSKVADLKENLSEAKKGIMKSTFQLNKLSVTRVAANDILKDPESKQEDLNEANYFLGKSEIAEENYPAAIAPLQKVVAADKTEIGAEATYLIALCYYYKLEDKKAEEWAYKVINNTPTYDYWLAKSYILIAELFMKQNDFFNAKATLQSIIDNYKHDDDIIPNATKAYNKALELENNSTKMENDKIQQDLQEDEPGDSTIIDHSTPNKQ